MYKHDLHAVRSLLSDPARWTKGYIARDAAGEPTATGSLDAVCFCLIGAALRAIHGPSLLDLTLDESKRVDDVLDLIQAQIPATGNIDEFNDDPETTHADILRILDAAISPGNGPPASGSPL